MNFIFIFLILLIRNIDLNEFVLDLYWNFENLWNLKKFYNFFQIGIKLIIVRLIYILIHYLLNNINNINVMILNWTNLIVVKKEVEIFKNLKFYKTWLICWWVRFLMIIMLFMMKMFIVDWSEKKLKIKYFFLKILLMLVGELFDWFDVILLINKLILIEI